MSKTAPKASIRTVKTRVGKLKIDESEAQLSPEALALLNEPIPAFEAGQDKRLDTTHSIEDIKAILRQALLDNIGKLLAQARFSQQLTLKEVAEKTGVKHPRVVQLERGENLELLTLARFAYALGYDLEIVLHPRNKGKVLRLRLP
jgi:DNA-directed RNA polymerase specialized sigma subunit